MEQLKNYVQLLRVTHWSKSIFVLLGVFYAHSQVYIIPALLAALAFCLISSAVYIYNDIEDRSEDKDHPHKSKRPLVSGKISLTNAVCLLFLLLVAGLVLGWVVSRQLAFILCVYLVVNIAYNHLLKFFPIIDVTCIAVGFMLRVLAGTIGIGLPISLWLTVTATLLSLFIALNKRQLEIQLGAQYATRRVLKKYHPQLLHWFILASGVFCFITYLLYIIYAREESFYFALTIPFAAIALWRFAWLSAQNVENDDPVLIFLQDRLSRFNLYCFIIFTLMALTR